MKTFIACLGASTLLLSLLGAAVAQNQLGRVNDVTLQASCPMGYFGGMQCFQATVSCPGVADIGVIFGYKNPASKPRGTVFFHNGGSGIEPYGVGDIWAEQYLRSYLSAGYQIVEMSWGSAWEDVGPTHPANIGTAACRPATLMNYVSQNVRTSGAMCAQGISAGSAAIVYALAWYGASSYLDKAELISGPVFGNIEKGCAVPNSPAIAVCPAGQFGCVGAGWLDKPEYITGALTLVRQWTGDNACQGKGRTSMHANDAWVGMSIVNDNVLTSFNYPKTALAGWLCSNAVNNSAAQGQYYYAKFLDSSQTAAYSVTRVDGCAGPEIVEPGSTPDGANARAAIIHDMTDPSVGCVDRH